MLVVKDPIAIPPPGAPPESNWSATRPLIFLDFETDGYGEADPAHDRIIQIGLFCPATAGAVASLDTKLVHPGPDFIPLRRTEIHGITDAMLEDKLPFKGGVAESLLEQLQGRDIVTFNGSGYDIPLLWEEFYRAGIEWDVSQHRLVDVATLWRKMEPRSLSDAVKRFTKREPVEGEMHNAGVDARYTADVLRGMLEEWAEAPRSIDELAKLTVASKKINGQDLESIDLAGVIVRNEQGDAVYSHKTNRGTLLKNDSGYAQWILSKDFSVNTKMAIRAELAKLETQRTLL